MPEPRKARWVFSSQLAGACGWRKRGVVAGPQKVGFIVAVAKRCDDLGDLVLTHLIENLIIDVRSIESLALHGSMIAWQLSPKCPFWG